MVSLPPVCQSIPEVSSLIQTQSSSDVNPDKGDMIEEIIKQVTHKLYETILTSNLNTYNTACAPNTRTSKASITTRVNDTLTPTDNTYQDSSIACQLPKHASLDSPNTDPYQNVTHTKINCLPRPNTVTTFTSFEHTKQMIMNIDTLLHSKTLHDKILQSLNFNGFCTYDSLHKTYIF